MSWRRFAALVSGLSPQSRFLHAVAQNSPAPGERVISDDADIDRFVATFGGA